jgi:hypothetical protein
MSGAGTVKTAGDYYHQDELHQMLSTYVTTGRDGRFVWPVSEFKLAARERSKYVLYRVYEADTENPRFKRVRDPVGKLVEVVVEQEKRPALVLTSEQVAQLRRQLVGRKDGLQLER